LDEAAWPSFEDVYRADYGRLVRAARRRTGSSQTAEEVVQDAFVALYPRFAQVERTGDPVRYVYRSVVNGCVSHHRRRGVAERLQHLVPPAEAHGPPQEIEIDETWLAIQRLPQRRRDVIVLRYYEDLSLADIAERLGCEVGTVKSMLHRALAQLREILTRRTRLR
jgi:RNA polymerase sigma-70 factor (sigma-E family)